MTFTQVRSAIARTARDIDHHHLFVLAAGLSYYFVLALFPALILLAAIVAYLPVPDLFSQGLDLMARIVPPDSMGLVRDILEDVITPGRGTFLSFGLFATFWALSGGFSALIEALNVAYAVPETRPIWKTRPLALALSFIVGAFIIVAVTAMVVGPRFGEWLDVRLHFGAAFAVLWPFLRWGIVLTFTVLAVEVIYFLAPNVKQRFRCSLPGAVVAVTSWILLSYLLGLYLRTFADFNKTYGTLGAAIALMIWLYWSGFAVLVGAEFNAEVLNACGAGRLSVKETVLQQAAAESAGADIAA